MRNRLKVWGFVLLISLLAGSGYAADWDFYGSVKLQVFNYESSEEREDYLAFLGETDPYRDFQFKLDKYTTKLGAWVTHDDLTAVVEIRPDNDGVGDDVMRLWYGSWDFGGGELLIGQSWTPLNMFYSSAAAEDDNNMLDYGALWELRHPMIQLTYKGLKLALVEPGDETSAFYSRASWAMAAGKIETKMPKIEAKYTHEMGPAKIDVYGGYNSYDFTLNANDKTVSIDSYVAGAGLTLTFGNFKVSGASYYAQNAGPMGLLQTVNYSDPELDANNDVLDNESFGWLAVASYIVNDKIRLEAGYSELETEIDDDAIWSTKDETAAYYFQVRYTVFDKFSIVPEVGFIDYKTAYFAWDGLNGDCGDKTYVGAKFQYDF